MEWERAAYPEVTVNQLMWKYGITRIEAIREKENQEQVEVWLSKMYQVEKKFCKIGKIDGWHLSIKRRDKHHIHNWRELQAIKNDLVGRENEGFELYPAESRLVDTANQYHIWVFCDPRQRVQTGFTERKVHDGTGEFGVNNLGGKQRGFNGNKS